MANRQLLRWIRLLQRRNNPPSFHSRPHFYVFREIGIYQYRARRLLIYPAFLMNRNHKLLMLCLLKGGSSLILGLNVQIHENAMHLIHQEFTAWSTGLFQVAFHSHICELTRLSLYIHTIPWRYTRLVLHTLYPRLSTCLPQRSLQDSLGWHWAKAGNNFALLLRSGVKWNRF